MPRSIRWILLAALALVVAFGVLWGTGAGSPDSQQAAGAMTVLNRTSASFEQPASGLSPAELRRHQEADVFFDRTHVPLAGAPGSGLGPRFIAASCIACHVRNGRGRPVPTESLVRVALRAGDGRKPLPELGGQIQDKAVLGSQPEAQVQIRWKTVQGPIPSRWAVTALRRPEVTFAAGQVNLSPDVVARSLRVAPPLLGLGLLEAVPERTITALADPDDRDGDGISGRVHWLLDDRGDRQLGRFGWKALTPGIREQSAAAYREDMGLTTPLRPGSELAADGQPADISNQELDLVSYYSQTLGAPRTARRSEASLVKQGQRLFTALECSRCHVPRLQTGKDPKAVAAVLNNQTIWAYTDLLLHDMGDGLDDGVAEGDASSREWRTAPLWGIGLARRVNEQASYLHDGRARTLEEAILWHGGEAARSRDRYADLPSNQRQILLGWLQQL